MAYVKGWPEKIVNVTMLALEEEMPTGTAITIMIRVPESMEGDMVHFSNYVNSNDPDGEALLKLIKNSVDGRATAEEMH